MTGPVRGSSAVDWGDVLVDVILTGTRTDAEKVGRNVGMPNLLGWKDEAVARFYPVERGESRAQLHGTLSLDSVHFGNLAPVGWQR